MKLAIEEKTYPQTHGWARKPGAQLARSVKAPVYSPASELGVFIQLQAAK